MFSSNLRFVPWKNREEFLKVYDDAYSEDSGRQARACQTMELWLVLRNDVPPGVECTLNILSAFQQENQSSRQLQLTFSTAVLRVVNMLCDNARQSGKETIYSIANYYNLPDWIVNLRHDVSHGTSLPDLSGLKRAATFLLSWLQEYYWEIEKEEIKDIILKRSRFEACKDNTEFYINTYVQLMELLQESGDIKIKQIKNEELMLKLFDVNKRRGFNCAIECIPWVMHAKENFAKEIPQDSIAKMRLTAFNKLILLQLQDYIIKSSFWQVDMLPLIIDAMCNHYVTRKTIVRDIWEPLIDKLNDWKMLDRVMQVLIEERRLQDEPSTKWFSEICRAVVKRHFSDRLRGDLSSSLILTDNIEEEELAAKTMLRKRLGLEPESSEKAVRNKLFTKIEKKYIGLKEVTRLTTPVQYIVNCCAAMQVIKALVLQPNEITISHLNYLFQIVNPELSVRKQEELSDLLLIRLGRKTLNKLPSLNNYTAKSLLDLYRIEKVASSRKERLDKVHTDFDGKDKMDVSSVEDKRDPIPFSSSQSNIVRSGWNFNNCPLGITPWEMEGTEYFHKNFDPQNAIPCKIFPIYSQAQAT